MKQYSPKIAIYYDWINQWGGAEQVLLDILNIFPDADILTLFYRPQQWLPSKTKIFTPPFNLKKYDLIISTTSYFGYYLPADIYYLHNINRYLYNTPFKFIDRLLVSNKKIFLCNSKNVQKRINQHLNIKANVVYPGIDTNKFIPTTKPSLDYFLVVSRFVKYKNIDSVIFACQKLKKKLVVVGTGRQEKYLKQIANYQYIKFTGKISQNQLIKLYQNCQALIQAQIEDFGLTALEAQACGRPVIARKAGGALETVTPKTGIFFTKNLTKAVSSFNPKNFNSKDCRQNALNFSRQKFMLNFKKKIYGNSKNK
jgi:glycosyltransferase involved in cell wall biosynthesis